MCTQASRHHHDTTGVLVQAMNNARPWQRRQRRVKMQQCILQGTVGIPNGRMHDQARGLVKHDNVIVGMNDVDRYVFGENATLELDQSVQLQGFTAENPQGGFYHSSIYSEFPAADPFLQAAPGELTEQLCSRLVQAQTRLAAARYRGSANVFFILTQGM